MTFTEGLLSCQEWIMEEKRVAGTKYEYFTHKNVFLVFKNKGTHSNSLYMNAILGGLKTHIVEVTAKE